MRNGCLTLKIDYLVSTTIKNYTIVSY